MKARHLIIYLMLCISLGMVQRVNAFEYNGLSYVPTGESTCAVTGFATTNPSSAPSVYIPEVAYDYDSEKAYLPTMIGANAFKNAGSVSIESWGNITEIGYAAFQNTRIAGDLHSSTVLKVGDFAFYSCNLLASVEFPKCMEIGNFAFAECGVLLNAIFPIVTKIGSYAFQNCVYLQHFELPPTLASIGEFAFSGCVEMDYLVNTDVVFLETIPRCCFQNCRDLKEFHFTTCIKTIDDMAFEGCSSLEEVNLPDDIRYIGYYAFRNCKSVKKVNISGCNTKTTRSSAFAGCPNIQKVRLCRNIDDVPFAIMFPDCKETLERVEIKEGSTAIGHFNDYGMSETEFGGFVKLKQVDIPEGVTLIGDLAFEGCIALKSINLPQSLTAIGPSAFKGSGLESIALPDNVQKMGMSVFEHCVNLKSIKWSTGLTQLPWQVCMNDSALEKVDLPVNITSIGRNAFANCVSVASVNIPGLQTEWESDYFANCPNIKTLTFVSDGKTPRISTLLRYSQNTLEQVKLLPGSTCLGTTGNGVDRIFSYATLAGFGKLRKVIIPDGVTMIGYQAFEGDTMLTEISLPASIDTIGSAAFKNTNIEKIVLPKRVKFIADEAFRGCKNLKQIGFPSGLNRIRSAAFQECTALTKVDLPFSVDTIEPVAFASCRAIQSITIGDHLKRLGDNAFSGCAALKSLTLYTPTVLTNISAYEYSPFYSINRDAILYVPASALQDYKNEWLWNNNYFKDILPIGATSVSTTTINIIPSECTVEIEWPVAEDDFYYAITIYNMSYEAVCQIVMYYDGEMYSTTYRAPQREKSPAQEPNGLSYKVVGLEQGTTYIFALQNFDEDGTLLDTKYGTFTTLSMPEVIDDYDIEEAIDNLDQEHHTPTKFIRNGQLYLKSDGRMYDVRGRLISSELH